MKRSPWSYKIDYAKEIAKDEATIAKLTDPAYVAACRAMHPDMQEQNERGWTTPRSFIFYVCWSAAGLDERASLLGLSRQDMIDVSLYCQRDEFLDLLGSRSGSHGNGAKICDTWRDWEVMTERERLRALANAKTDLARHKRNQKKFG